MSGVKSYLVIFERVLETNGTFACLAAAGKQAKQREDSTAIQDMGCQSTLCSGRETNSRASRAAVLSLQITVLFLVFTTNSCTR